MGLNRDSRLPCVPAFVLAFATLVACTEPNPAYDVEQVCPADEYFVGQEFHFADAGKVDLLLVVDDSPGMLANQRALAEAMPNLVSRLTAVDDLDWRVGVISTDPADGGALQTGPAGQGDCPAVLPDYVSRSVSNAGAVLGCNVVLGQDGSDYEAGLESARMAIRDGGASFLRADARLVVVFFSDEDDCSGSPPGDDIEPNDCVWQASELENVQNFVSYFSSEARRRAGSPVSVVAIVAPRDNRSYAEGEPPAPACSGETEAYSGNRYITVAESGRQARYGFHESVCATSYVATVERIVEEAVVIEDDTVCLGEPISGQPRVVILETPDNTAVAELSADGDYLTLGVTPDCAEGAVAVSPVAHGDGVNQVEIRFCTTEDPEQQ